jgi:hypothetical protein
MAPEVQVSENGLGSLGIRFHVWYLTRAPAENQFQFHGGVAFTYERKNLGAHE